MRFIHVSDTHLGAVPYGLSDREIDIYEAFKEVIDIAISYSVDAVLHAGDMFHDSNPRASAYVSALKHLFRLKEKGIAFYVVGGNHEIAKTKGASPLQVLETLDLAKVLSTESEPGSDVFTDKSGRMFEIVGFSHKASKDLFKQTLTSDRDRFDGRIALAHVILCDAISITTGVSESLCADNISGSPFFSSRIAKGYSYIALGDLHKSWEGRTSYGAPVIYPGSIEALSVSEYSDKRYVYLVEVDRDHVDYRKIELKSPRPWIVIEAESFREAINKLESISWNRFSKEPIVYITIEEEISRIDRDRIISLLNNLRSEGKILYYRGPLTSGSKTSQYITSLESSDTIDEHPVNIESVVKSLFGDDEASKLVIELIENPKLGEDEIMDKLVENSDVLAKLYTKLSRGRSLYDY